MLDEGHSPTLVLNFYFEVSQTPGTPGHSLIHCPRPPGAPWLSRGGEAVLKEGKLCPQSAAKGLGPDGWRPRAMVRPLLAVVTFGLGSVDQPGYVSWSRHLAVVQDTTHYQAPWVQGSKLASGAYGQWTVGILTFDELVLAQALGVD